MQFKDDSMLAHCMINPIELSIDNSIFLPQTFNEFFVLLDSVDADDLDAY